MATPTQIIVPPRRRSMFGPVILIGFGVVMLMVTMGKLDAKTAAYWFAQYWPLIFIFWGAVKLIEHMQARHEGYTPPGIGAGGVVLLIFVLLIGSAASAIYRSTRHLDWGKVRDEMNMNNEDFGDFFGTKFKFSSNIDQVFPANATLKVVGERGGVKISPSSDGKLHVVVNKAIYAGSQDEANKINSGFPAQVIVVDNIVTLDTSHHGSWNGGTVDLEILVPRKAPLDLSLLRGDININGREGAIKANTARGDVTLEDVAGNAYVGLRSGSLIARHIKGDVTMDGRAQDTKISDISGLLTLQGEIFGEIELSNLGKGLRFKSTRTDMELAKLEGDLNMSGGDLRANAVSGPIRITTRSKDIHLEDVSGDVKVDDTNGEVEVHSKSPVGNIEIRDQKGDIRLTLPSNANFEVDAISVRGELSSDFNLNTENKNNEVHSTGTVNKGGVRIQLHDEHGNIAIRKQ